MTAYIVPSADGQIIHCGTVGGASPVMVLEAIPGSIIVDSPVIGKDYYYWDGTQVLPIPAKPSESHIFDYATKLWVDPRSLEDFKAAQWTKVKQARTQAEYAGFTWDGSIFDSDATSQNRITGAVTLAQMSTDFSIDWILANNTLRTLDQVGMLQVGAALGIHVAEQFSKGAVLRTAIEAATSRQEIEIISWG